MTLGIDSAFSNFQIVGSNKRRALPLGDVMPINKDFACAVVLTDAYLSHSGDNIAIRGFNALCDSLGEPDVNTALINSRKNGELFEGEKRLTHNIVNFLKSKIGSDFFCMRCVDNDKKYFFNELDTSILEEDLTKLGSCHVGDFEVCDSQQKIYIRFRDDDSVMFISAHKDFIQELASTFNDNVLEVPFDYIYSY